MRLLDNSDYDSRRPPVKSGTPSAVRILLIVFGSLFALILVLFIVFLAIRAHGKQLLLGEKVEVSAPSELVESAEDDGTKVVYNGETYTYNENIVSILFLGVDKKNIAAEAGYGKNGQADSLFVAAFDTATGSIKIIPLSREAMTDVNIYTSDGSYGGIENTQLCLAYAYGATGAESCENVRRSAERLLYGVKISSYVAIDLNGVRALTDAIGGVNVTALESLKDGSGKLMFTEGQNINLTGALAELYIRQRDNDVEANNRRMQRQKQFMSAFASKAGNQILANFTRLGEYYGIAKPYLVSDLTFSEITYLASCSLTTDIGKSIAYMSIAGNTVMGEAHTEFYPDKVSLYETVLNTFYSKTVTE